MGKMWLNNKTLNRSIEIRVILAMLLFSSFAIKTQIIHAQTVNFEVFPAKTNILLTPGETIQHDINIRNFTGKEQTFYVYAVDFRVNDSEGRTEFLESNNDETYSMAKWISIDNDIVQVPNEQIVTVPVNINVPSNAEPGGHYSAIFVQTTAPESQGGNEVRAISRVGALLLGTVPGKTSINLTLVEFTTDKNIYFSNEPLISFTSMLKNSGNVHAIPSGVIFLKGGYALKAQNIIYNEAQAAVLPEAPARSIPASYQIKNQGWIPPIGKITAELHAKYDKYPSENMGTVTFWLIPIRFILIVLFSIIVALFIIWRVLVSYKR